jgi:putative two-component system response regulator
MENLSKRKILVVDDAEINTIILVEALEDEYDVSVAMDGERALEAVVENKPDLILLDIMMPGIDGYQVCKRIKKDPATKDIPIIFVTGVGEALQRSLGFGVGCVDFLSKPFEMLEVKAKIKTYLSLIFLQKENTLLKQEIKSLKGS